MRVLGGVVVRVGGALYMADVHAISVTGLLK